MARPNQQPQTAKVADVIQTYQPSRRFPNHSAGSITSIDFDDTGELCLIAQDDETLQIYNTKEGKHAKELKSQKYGVDLARFTHHSQSMIYASTKGDDAIRYLSSHDNSFIRYFRGHTAPVTCLTLNPSNDTFLSCSLDNTLRLWNLNSASCTGLLDLTTPLLAAYDPTASVIAIACLAAKTILLYDVRNFDKAPFASFEVGDTEETIARSPAVQKAGGVGKWTKLEFSNDGARILLATTGAGHFVLDAFEGEVVSYCLRSAGSTGRTAPSDFGNVRSAQEKKLKVGGGGAVAATGQGDACFTPDGKFVIGGAGEGEVCVWDVGRGVDEATADKILKPVKELGSGATVGKQNKVLAYDPRFNLFAAADRNLVFWAPDLE